MTTEKRIEILMKYASRVTTSTHACRDGLKSTKDHAHELALALKEAHDALFPNA